MNILELIFWLCLGTIFYSYVGYAIVLIVLLKLKKRMHQPDAVHLSDFTPDVTLIIAAYNERDYIEAKVRNSMELDYPPERLQIMVVTDGSTDGTPEVLEKFDNIIVLHESTRSGKVAAINRAMNYVTTPFVVFSDANTMLNRAALREIMQHYQHSKVGAVSGEKRIQQTDKDDAGGAGEGLYWKYESFLKRLDAELYSIVGAAGELFSVRTALFEQVEADTILDDFIITLRIASKGYRVMYEPNAYALETPSASISDELKRKIRISAGGFQSIARLKNLLNPLQHGILSFQYISHRVLRWAVNPFALFFLMPLNFILYKTMGGGYTCLFIGQLVFYLLAAIGWYFEDKKIHYKILFIPLYFVFMHYAAILGFIRYVRKKQSPLWEKAKRSG